MITAATTIKEPPRVLRPIDIAADCYRRWCGAVNFIDDLDDYHLTGIVVSRPDIFLMAKATELPDNTGKMCLTWFIRIFVGPLDRLMPALPPWPIGRIGFCRRGDDRVRTWPIERMLRLEKLGLKDKLRKE